MKKRVLNELKPWVFDDTTMTLGLEVLVSYSDSKNSADRSTLYVEADYA